MQLTRVDLHRFKAFEEASFEVRPLTVVIGPNNAGKSSLLQALAILAQSAPTGQLQSCGNEVDLGLDPDALIHRGDRPTTSSDGWKVDLQWDEDADVPGIPEPIVVSTRLDVQLVPKLGTSSQNVRTEAEVCAKLKTGEEVALTVTGPGPMNPTVSLRNVPEALNANLQVPVSGLFNFELREAPTDFDLNEVRARNTNAIRGFALEIAASRLREIQEAISSYRYVGPDRTVNRSRFSAGQQPIAYLRTADDVINTLIYNRDVLRNVSERCRSVFGYGIDLVFVPQLQVELVAMRADDTVFNVSNLGSGLIQLVWILVALELSRQQTRSSSTMYPIVVGIEEPELHLHPRVQPDVARILAAYARDDCQVICTSQSEHFLMAVLQMVLDGELKREDLSVYYVEDGRTERLEVDGEGRLSRGLRGFFEANEQELLRRIEALIERG